MNAVTVTTATNAMNALNTVNAATAAAARSATQPTLIVPPSARPLSPSLPARNILCPVDFTPGSVVAWCHALAYAQASQGLVTLLHVLDEDDAVTLPAVRGGRPRFLQVAEARARLGMAVSGQLLRSCLVRLSVEAGPAVSHTIEAAERHDIDLIVLGVNGPRPPHPRAADSADALLEALMAQARCPVLVVPAPQGSPDWDAEFDVPGGRHQGALPYSLSASW